MNCLKDFRLFIGWCHTLLRAGVRNRGIIKDNSLFLKNGNYRSSLRGDYIYETNSRLYLRGKTYSSLDHLNRFFDSVLNYIAGLFDYEVKNNKESRFQGTEIIISSSQTEIKIFAIDSEEVVTKYQCIDKVKKIIKAKEWFGMYYNVPETKVVDYNSGYIVEKYIHQVNYDSVEAFHFFCKKFINYITEIKETISYDNEGDQKKVEKFIGYVGNSDIITKVVGLPKLVVHGDFWRYNVIFDGFKYYLLDFEKCGVKFFLYDFYCFILSDSLLLNDNCLLELYFKGVFDDTLSKLFEVVGLCYDSEKREVYFLAFIVEICDERWTKAETVEIINKIPYIKLKSL